MNGVHLNVTLAVKLCTRICLLSTQRALNQINMSVCEPTCIRDLYVWLLQRCSRLEKRKLYGICIVFHYLKHRFTHYYFLWFIFIFLFHFILDFTRKYQILFY